MTRRAQLSAAVRLDEDGDLVFAPSARVNAYRLDNQFGIMEICNGLELTAHDPEIFERLAASALALAADLRAARAGAAGGAS